MKKKKKIWALVGLSLLMGGHASAAITWDGDTLKTDNVLYYVGPADIAAAKKIVISTTVQGKTSPLQGFGVYLSSNINNLTTKEIEITTTGSQADAIRINSEASAFVSKTLKINASGSSADGINIASDFNQNYDSWVKVLESADIRVKDGVAVRANAYRNEGARSLAILPDGSYIEVYGTGTASNSMDSIGYAVYAGNRDKDTNGMGGADILAGKTNNTKGDAYVFIGDNSTIKTATKNGHAVYANKGGFIQLGDGVDISTTGANALTIYASTEQQGNYTDNVRPGTVFLAGGAKLRAANSVNVIQARGADSIITSKEIADPTVPVLRSDRVTIADLNTAVATRGIFDIEGNIDAASGGTVDLNFADSSLLKGSTSVDASSIVNLDITGTNSKWIMTKNSTLTNLTLTHGATVYLSDETDLVNRQILTVNGDYHGQNGQFVFNGVLGDDTTPIDKVIINGDVSGITGVSVNNLGGLGAKTLDGIEIIHVGGNSPQGSFLQAHRIVAGAYDYFLTKGDEHGNDTNDWYLTNKLIQPPTPPGPDPDPEPSLRPEGGAYLGNAYAANNLFQLTLHDRVGEVALMNWNENGLQDKDGNIWARYDKRKSYLKEKSNQIDLRQDYDTVQVGLDLIRKQKNNRLYLFGIMGGYGNAQTNATGYMYDAKGTVEGYSVGLYGTIYDERKDRGGKYIDTWVLWNKFDGRVAGYDLSTEKYGLDGITASVEVGYDQLAKKHETNSNRNLWLKWQAQVTYQGVRADEHREENGTLVGKNDDNFQTRLGVRLYQKRTGESNRWHQPYVELNWHHNFGDYAVSMDGEYDFSAYGVRDMAELKLGYEGQINKNMQLWGNIFGGLGAHGTYTYGARLGVKYTF